MLLNLFCRLWLQLVLEHSLTRRLHPNGLYSPTTDERVLRLWRSHLPMVLLCERVLRLLIDREQKLDNLLCTHCLQSLMCSG